MKIEKTVKTMKGVDVIAIEIMKRITTLADYNLRVRTTGIAVLLVEPLWSSIKNPFTITVDKDCLHDVVNVEIECSKEDAPVIRARLGL